MPDSLMSDALTYSLSEAEPWPRHHSSSSDSNAEAPTGIIRRRPYRYVAIRGALAPLVSSGDSGGQEDEDEFGA